MKKTREEIQERLRRMDAVIELRDARIPLSSRNPVLDELLGNKPRILLLTKKDLADQAVTDEWISHYREEGLVCRAVDIPRRKGLAGLAGLCRQAAGNDGGRRQEKRRAGRNRAVRRKGFKVMVVGIPNVGKSALLNGMIGRRKAEVGDKAGVTRHFQRAVREDGLMVFDTPGVLWPRLDDQQAALKLSLLGALKDSILDERELALQSLRLLCRRYSAALSSRYGISGALPSDTAALLSLIGTKRGALLPGGRVDLELSARYLIQDVRSGRLGPITLDNPGRPS